MEQYMKATATPFVHHALKDTILKIMESKQSCEVKGGWRRVHSQVSLWYIVLYRQRKLTGSASVLCKSSHSAVVGDFIHLMYAFSPKLNPSKLEKNEDVNLNLSHLLNILSELVEKIFMAAEILPP